jgi:hypothetical protein
MHVLPTHLSNVIYTPWQISQRNNEMLFIHQLPCHHPLQPLITVLLHQILLFWIFLMIRHDNKPMQCNITNLLNIFSYPNVNASFSSAGVHLLITVFLPEQTVIRQMISSTYENN